MLKEAHRDLLTFCQLLDPNFEAAWFHEIIAEKLQSAIKRVMEEKGKARIILTIPPRHGKSTLASQYFPAWALGKYPDIQFILSTYGSDLSEKMGLKTRDIISSEKYQAIFPGTILRPDVKAKARWMTKTGGTYTAVGTGSAVTGTGGNFILLDDPHKDRAEAESATIRESVWQYYRDTLYTRLEGYGGIVVIMQRWHTDDLVGRILEEDAKRKAAGQDYDDWEVINFPAIAEQDEYHNGQKVRSIGQPLWTNKFPLDVLNNIKAGGSYRWASQYMQNPILSESQEFKEEMFKRYNEEDLVGKNLRYYTLVDPAISQKKESDNGVVLTVAKEAYGPNIYRIKEDAGHFTPQQTIDLLFKHQREYASTVGIEVTAFQMALKYSVEEEQRKRQQYFPLIEVKTRVNKEVKIKGLVPLYERGVIYHKHTDVDYELELLAFPRGKRDDRADAMAMALQVMENTPSGMVAKVFKPKWAGYGRK